MKRFLPTLVLAQFLCTSLWFAGNAVIGDMIRHLQASQGQQGGAGFLGHLTSAIQLGFIAGTLVFALLSIADRISPSRVFFLSALLAGLFNLGITLPDLQPAPILAFRFLTGFFLAGIYPVGMKIAADYSPSGLGRALGFLVGALVLGTAFPHLLRSLSADWPWRYILYATTLLSFAGGLAIWLLVPDGPYRKASRKLQLNAFLKGFSGQAFRQAAFGYFGHMWELYSFWAFLPLMIGYYNELNPDRQLPVSLLSFLVIALGSVACATFGSLSQRYGAQRLAALALAVSGACCLLSPLFLQTLPPVYFISFLAIWGWFVIADSPLFSTLVAQRVDAEFRGSSLTIVNCIGFSITILSIQSIQLLAGRFSPQWLFLFLAIGPALGLFALLKNEGV